MRREAEAPAGAERRQSRCCSATGGLDRARRPARPEDLRAVVDAYHRAVAAAVGAQGGYVAKFLGDGVLAYFGWPRAHEDDAERAVRAGLAAVDGRGAAARAGWRRVAARVGIATGPVVVGDLLGEGRGARAGRGRRDA